MDLGVPVILKTNQLRILSLLGRDWEWWDNVPIDLIYDAHEDLVKAFLHREGEEGLPYLRAIQLNACDLGEPLVDEARIVRSL